MVKDESANSEKFDAMQEFGRSKGWALVRARISDELDRQCLQLEEPKDMWETSSLRGAVKALRMVLEIPAILKEEFRKEG